MSKILISEKQYDHHWLSDLENSNAQNMLRRNHQSLYRPVCCCLSDTENRELSVKKRTRFFLAKMPGTGENHAQWCEFFGDSFSNQNNGVLPAIIERNGVLDINLESYLSITSNGGNTPAPIHASSLNRSTITLLGLLNLLLEQAKINYWRPNRQYDQTFNNVQKQVVAASEHMIIRKMRLSKILVIPKWLKNLDARKKLNQDNFFKKTPPEKGAIVIGQIDRWIDSTKEPGGIGVKLKLLDHLLWMTPEMAAKTTNSFSQLILEIGKTDRHILAICTVYRSGLYCTISDIFLMRVSEQFIPVESSYELHVVNRLVAEKRFFYKPIRSRPVFLERVGFLPDFVLTDCEPDCVMEVFGIDNNPEYLTQKDKKLAYYRENNIPCWQWSPKENTCIPKLPDRS